MGGEDSDLEARVGQMRRRFKRGGDSPPKLFQPKPEYTRVQMLEIYERGKKQARTTGAATETASREGSELESHVWTSRSREQVRSRAPESAAVTKARAAHVLTVAAMMKQSSVHEKTEALRELSQMGEEGAPYGEAVAGRLGDGDPYVRAAALRCLVAMGEVAVSTQAVAVVARLQVQLAVQTNRFCFLRNLDKQHH